MYAIGTEQYAAVSGDERGSTLPSRALTRARRKAMMMYRAMLRASVFAVLAWTGCTADEPAPSSATYTVTTRTGAYECPVCPIAIAKQAAGETVASACTEHCENCGNGVCDLDETSNSCYVDCPATPPPGNPWPPSSCGNGYCSPGEEYTCPRDCGPVPPIE